MKKIILIAVLSISVQLVFAQKKKPAAAAPKTSTAAPKSSFKLGYVFEDLILDNYKGVKTLQEKVSAKQEQTQATYNQMAIDYQTKYLDYQNSIKNIDTLTTESLNAKLKAVQASKEKAETFQRTAEKEAQDLMGAGIQAIRVEIDLAIKAIAAEKKYPFVLIRFKNGGLLKAGTVILYSADGGRDNLTDAVLAKLNNTPSK
jgi:outer membrane protein